MFNVMNTIYSMIINVRPANGSTCRERKASVCCSGSWMSSTGGVFTTALLPFLCC